MFCASLRRRPSFVAVCNDLTLTASGRLQGKEHYPGHICRITNEVPENQLTTHDIAVPSGFNVDPRTGTRTSDRKLRVLLFSPSAVADNNLEATIARIEALTVRPDAELNDSAIVFLLSPRRNTSFLSAKLAVQDDDNDTTEGVLAYMKLQVALKDQKEIPSIPTLPVPRLEDIPALVQRHARAITRQHPLAAPPRKTLFELLTQCSAEPPMREQTAYVCTDIFNNVREMAQACISVSSAPTSSSPSARAAMEISSQYFGENCDVNGVPVSSHEGGAQKKLKMLRDMVGDRECQNVVDFWKEEFVVE